MSPEEDAWLLTEAKKQTEEAAKKGLGHKADADKLRFDLLPVGPVTDIVRVLTFGAKKYADDNWQKVPNRRRRYYAAGMRHFLAWWRGEKLDPETKLPHLAHLGCCVLFLLWNDEDGGGE